jgi:F-type H+-transporting ATPase subunit epsilon
MANTFALKVVTPTGIVFEGDVEEVTAEDPIGQFGVLPEHINFITSLVPGILEIKLPGGDKLYYVVSGGLAEVKDGAMTVLADGAEDPGAIKIEEVEVQIREVEERLLELSMYADEYELSHHNLLLANARRRAATELRSSR